jgi:hypothetical protein
MNTTRLGMSTCSFSCRGPSKLRRMSHGLRHYTRTLAGDRTASSTRRRVAASTPLAMRNRSPFRSTSSNAESGMAMAAGAVSSRANSTHQLAAVACATCKTNTLRSRARDRTGGPSAHWPLVRQSAYSSTTLLLPHPSSIERSGLPPKGWLTSVNEPLTSSKQPEKPLHLLRNVQGFRVPVARLCSVLPMPTFFALMDGKSCTYVRARDCRWRLRLMLARIPWRAAPVTEVSVSSAQANSPW